jgi:cell wall-associated NlpC family hydrolase
MGKMIATQHAMIYIGDGKISHAANKNTGIKTEVLKDTYRWTDGHHFFVRPKDLKEADAREGSNSSTSTPTTPSTEA